MLLCSNTYLTCRFLACVNTLEVLIELFDISANSHMSHLCLIYYRFEIVRDCLNDSISIYICHNDMVSKTYKTVSEFSAGHFMIQVFLPIPKRVVLLSGIGQHVKCKTDLSCGVSHLYLSVRSATLICQWL